MWPIVIGAGAAVALLVWLFGGAQAQSAPTTQGTIVVKVKRGRRKLWEGAGEPPAQYLPRPKYKTGDLYRVKDEIDGKITLSTPRKVLARSIWESVEYPAGDLTKPVPVAGVPLNWMYQMEDPSGEPWWVDGSVLVQ